MIELGDVLVTLTRKDVKHVHLTVHPPTGRVTLVTPNLTRTEVARAYVISKLAWIRNQRIKLEAQAREAPRQFVERESHYLWGRRYLMSITEADEKPTVKLGHRRLTLQVRPGSSPEKRAELVHEWHKSLMHSVVPDLIAKWGDKLGVEASRYFLQRMKTKWGSCNPARRHIRLNTELVKKPKDLLEYVVVHEMAHLLEPSHNDRFQAILDRHWPQWRESRAELNALPLTSESWAE
ncbi:MAG: SprT family zinc-dependent metalloprotease [Hydrogenophaga sp.]|nr:SprT family zinc-dependent metalloprotease [Hydrogenophaga sp.]